MAGYHVADIPRGKYGELSKVLEEVMEALDAEQQGNPIMVLQELSDIVGAIQKYLEKHPSICFQDLVTMAYATARAFEEGVRT
jgi:hypothetical protein